MQSPSGGTDSAHCVFCGVVAPLSAAGELPAAGAAGAAGGAAPEVDADGFKLGSCPVLSCRKPMVASTPMMNPMISPLHSFTAFLLVPPDLHCNG